MHGLLLVALVATAGCFNWYYTEPPVYPWSFSTQEEVRPGTFVTQGSGHFEEREIDERIEFNGSRTLHANAYDLYVGADEVIVVTILGSPELRVDMTAHRRGNDRMDDFQDGAFNGLVVRARSEAGRCELRLLAEGAVGGEVHVSEPTGSIDFTSVVASPRPPR